MGEIKSAREIAEEKVAEIGEPTEAERLQWRYNPEGEKLAGRYLKETFDLAAALEKFDAVARKHVAAAARNILLRNIDLPRNEIARGNLKRTMDGLRALINDKVSLENIFSKIRQITEHYATQGDQQKQQAYETLKAEFTQRLQQAMRQQYGTAQMPANINLEAQPQFQEEWRRVQSQLETQYHKLLDEYKQEIMAL